MILSKDVEVTWNAGNKKWYVDKGYVYTKMGDKFIVNVNDLNPKGAANVEVLCDYCNVIINKKFMHYLDGRKIVEKDCCDNVECMKQKREEVMILKHGVKNPNQKQSVVEKRKKTNLKIYGYENAMQNKEVREKTNKTIKEIYGVENISQLEEIKKKKEETLLINYGVTSALKSPIIREKIKKTCIERYGGNNPSCSNEVRNKARQTTLNNYGVEYHIQLPGETERRKEIMVKTMYKNGTIPCSTQQKYLHNLLGGELNYPISKNALDIAFVEEFIFCEYNGSGHMASVRYYDLTEEEFKTKERNRNYYLSKLGWKRIQIESKKDYLPSDEKIIELIHIAKEYLNLGHSWFEINIDEGKLKCSQYEIDYDFGNLRKIHKNQTA